MFRIGEFSKLAKTTVKTLRFYDEIELFTPSFVDDNGYRYYSVTKLYELQRIIELRGFDIPIEGIKKILTGTSVVDVLNNRKCEIENELCKNKNNLDLINKLMAVAKKGDFMKEYQATEIIMPECIVYYKKGVIKDYSGMNDFVLSAGAEVSKNNPELKCSGYCFITYTAKEYRKTDIELEYVEAVADFGKESENIKFKSLPQEKAISIMHKGRYDKLGEVYAYGVSWIKENGYEIANPIRERYIDGCWNKSDESEYLTEIQIPVK